MKERQSTLQIENNNPRDFSYMPLVWLLFIVLAANALFFILSVAAPHVRADVWRHLDEIVIPFLEGAEGPAVFWSNHHPSPLLHIIQLINLEYLGFRLDYHAFLGFTFQLLTTFLMVCTMYRLLPAAPRQHHYLYLLGLLLVVAVQFGFSTLDQYAWPLVATVQYLYFFGLLVYLLVDYCLRAPSTPRFMLVAAAALLLMFANASYGTIFLVAMVGALTLVFIIDRRGAYLTTALVLGTVWAGYYLWLYLVTPKIPYAPSQSTLEILLHYLKHPVGVITRFALAVLAGLVNVRALKETLPPVEPVIIAVALVLFLSVVATFVIFLARKLYRVTIIPLALMLIAVAFGGPALITRFLWIADDPWGLTKPRYATTYKLVVIGAVWALLLIIGHSSLSASARRRRAIAVTASVAVFVVLALKGVRIYNGWQMAPEMALKNRRDELAIFHAARRPPNTTNLPFRVTGYGGVRGTLDYLDQNDLNVFAADFPGDPAVRQMVEARRQFESAGTFAAVSTLYGTAGVIANWAGEPLAKWSRALERVKLENVFMETLYLRVRVRSGKHVDDGFVVSSSAGISRHRSIGLLRGQQDLYFTLESEEVVELWTREPATIVEIGLRR